jgi:DNA-binding NtrC family response regulator
MDTKLALRDRREDLPGLVSQLLGELAPGRELRLSDAAAAAVIVHNWPGNLGELHERLAQAVLVADGNTVTPDMLGLPAPDRPQFLSLREIRHAAEREAITRALRHCHGQVPTAAAMLGISRAQLYRLISRLRLDHHAVAEHVPTTAPNAAG